MISQPGNSLGLGRHWHFAAIGFWVLNGLVYVVLLFASGEWPRLIPTSWSVFPEAWQTFTEYITFPHAPSLGISPLRRPSATHLCRGDIRAGTAADPDGGGPIACCRGAVPLVCTALRRQTDRAQPALSRAGGLPGVYRDSCDAGGADRLWREYGQYGAWPARPRPGTCYRARAGDYSRVHTHLGADHLVFAALASHGAACTGSHNKAGAEADGAAAALSADLPTGAESRRR